MKQRIHILDANSFSKIGIIDHAAKLAEHVWSPDSKLIAMISGADIHDPTEGRLLVASSTGGKPKAIAAKFKGKFEDIAWADANTIRFIVSEGVYTSFGTISSNGKKLQKSIDKGSTAFGHFSASDAGTIAMIGSAANHPTELFIYEGKTAKKLTDSNPWLADKKLGKQEVITYKAQDGLKIEGVVVLPLDYKKAQSIP